jgi:sulfur-carrier protein
MKIQLNLFASLTKFLPKGENGGFSNWVEIGEGTVIQALLDQLQIPKELPKIIFVNGLHAEVTTILKEGDRLGVFPPLAGG